MRCTFCFGLGKVRGVLVPFDTLSEAASACIPCPECGGTGILHCCEGEPTQAMIDAAPGGDLATLHGAVYVWRAMIEEAKRAAEGGDSAAD